MSLGPDVDGPQRCSAWSRLMAIDPIGTIGPYEGYLVVDCPQPWPKDVGEVPQLAALGEALRGTKIRIQAVVPDEGSESVGVATLYRQPVGSGFAGYVGQPVVVEAGSTLAGAVAEVLATAPAPSADPDVVLVCTHGRRDVCCGSSGTALALDLDRQPAPLHGRTLRRTSHTGGHRFAPTAVLLPEGTSWAYLDADTLGRIIERSGPVADVLAHYRGCAGLGSRRIQALEREVLGQVGWELFDRRRSGEELDGDRVRLTVETGDGGVTAWEADVTVGRRVPIPDCGRPIEESGKVEQELAVGPVAVVTPA